METQEQVKLAIAEQFVRKTEQGEYDGPWYELVVILEDGTELSRHLEPKPGEEERW